MVQLGVGVTHGNSYSVDHELDVTFDDEDMDACKEEDPENVGAWFVCLLWHRISSS